MLWVIMQDKWYSDNRDLVKWSTLLLIARKYRSERILQIAYFRHSQFSKVTIDEKEFEIPSEVLAHFRDIRKITKLTTQPGIVVFADEFEDRDKYLTGINKFIKENSKKQRCIVFLDPDTGLEPRTRRNHKHVLGNELKKIWDELPPKWIIAFYQHKTTKKREEWIEPKRKQFSEAINIPLNAVKVAYGFRIANDVVFFFAVKPV